MRSSELINITIKNLNVLCFKWEDKRLPYLDEIGHNFTYLKAKKF